MKVHIDPDYLPFITEGFVSMLGSKDLVPVKILRDTGASESFVLESVLPFSAETDLVNSVLISGIGLNTLSVPLHKLMLDCGLVKLLWVCVLRCLLRVSMLSLGITWLVSGYGLSCFHL